MANSQNQFLKKKRVLPKPVVGGLAGVALFITGHEQTQLTESAVFFIWCIHYFQGI